MSDDDRELVVDEETIEIVAPILIECEDLIESDEGLDEVGCSQT
ncbi:MAG TPA: hypothetical protein VMC79_00510 [Rectinemataceae bacterium]|nr:hypothetical protein [Rectinemataceae bacterium]